MKRQQLNVEFPRNSKSLELIEAAARKDGLGRTEWARECLVTVARELLKSVGNDEAADA